MKTYHQFYINGEWVDPAKGVAPFDVIKPANEEVIEQITRLNVNMESCTTHFIQYAGVAGLNAPKSETQEILDKLQGRRDILVEILYGIDGVEAHMPEAGFYVFPKINGLIAYWQGMKPARFFASI